MANENLVALQEAYAQWHGSRGRSPQLWIDLCDDQVARASPALYGDAEPRVGKGELMAYFERLASEWEDVIVEVDEFIADGDRVVVLSRLNCRNRATGKTLAAPKVDIYRFKDGRIIDCVEHVDTAATAAARMP